MKEKRFKSIDDFAKYTQEQNLINNRHNTKNNELEPDKKTVSKGQKKKFTQRKKKNIYQSSLNKESFHYYQLLPVVDKKLWLKEKGIKNFQIKGRYNSSKGRVTTDTVHPFTKEFIEFDYSDRELKSGSIVSVNLVVNGHPRNKRDIFNYYVHKTIDSNIETSVDSKIREKCNQNTKLNISPQKTGDSSGLEEFGDYKKIHFDDFVTTTDSNSCTKNKHDIEEIDAVVFVLRKSGKIIEKMVPASYCRTCKRYYISRWQYENICELGTPLWQNISEYGGHHAETHSYYDELNAESILHRSGYNVGSEDDLTAEQRHTILTLLVESKLCDKHKIVSHLTWLINSRQGNKSMQNAVGKWKEDRNFIDSYHLGTHRIVGISVIRHRV